jgi:hypothetical protein
MDDNLIKLLSAMSNEENDFDIELREGNKLTQSITDEEARSWRPIDDYSDLDYDFSNVKALINHPEIPDKLED